MLIAIISLGISMNTIASLGILKLTEINHICSNIAISSLEQIAAIDISNLDDSYDENNSSVTWPGVEFTFTRVIDVTVNADDSRTIDVTVSSNSATVPTSVNFSTTFAVWE